MPSLSAATSITVEPSMEQSFEMFFSENFKKSFVFSITPVEMPISIGRLRPEDPSFLQAELLKDKVGVEIVLDG